MRQDILVNDEQADLFGWLQKRIQLPRSEDFRAIGRVVDGQIVGVWGYDRHILGYSCQMHCAGDGPHWLNRSLLWKAFQVPFVEWGYKVLIAPIGSDNPESIRLATSLGFVECGSIPDAHPDGALHLYRLSRDAGSKWLKVRYRDSHG